MKTTRRTFLGASAAISLAPVRVSANSPVDDKIEQDLLQYLNFGNKRAGGAGDTACGNWLASELATAGYAVERQYYEVPFFEAMAKASRSTRNRSSFRPARAVWPDRSSGWTAMASLPVR